MRDGPTDDVFDMSCVSLSRYRIASPASLRSLFLNFAGRIHVRNFLATLLGDGEAF